MPAMPAHGIASWHQPQRHSCWLLYPRQTSTSITLQQGASYVYAAYMRMVYKADRSIDGWRMAAMATYMQREGTAADRRRRVIIR